MHSLPALPHSDPAPLYRWRDDLYAVDLLVAAVVWLDLFSWLDDHPTDLAGLCDALVLHERPADVMVTLFAAMGLLSREAGVLRPTQLARDHLVTRSPFFLGPYYASFKERPVCLDLVRVLRTGKPANWAAVSAGQDWAASMADPEFAQAFTSAMDCRGLYLGPLAARATDPGSRRRLLDIAGGSGIYACAFVAEHPQLRACVFEKPPVDSVTQQALASRGFSDRVDVRAGDMLVDPLPRGFDLHLLSNVLHDWDAPTVRQLLARSFEALDRGGLLVVHDAHLDADKAGPLTVAAYSVLLMHSTEGRCYSVQEMSGFMETAGFTEPRVIQTAADRSLIVAERR